ncbi:hypothetical protein FSP39_012856 [Pinctada imbricata]|uniref:Hexosyltransferase n=1 Tax=Pinctada imbricata TaxID=66713 RepID=A0AA89C3B2_PINIB|nr:hypothetical protein FSP39_012856 [Pinctada imbricata]
MRSSPSLERKLNKHATTILIGGIFLSFSLIMYLTLCNMPCEDNTYGILHNDLKEAQNQAFWKKHILAPARSVTAVLFIVIMSAPKNLQRRDTIRETWGKNLPKTVKLQFVIGHEGLDRETKEEIARENLIHHDVLPLENLIDSYANLTLKLLETLKWVDRMVDFQYFLKADEDTLIRVDKILLEVQKLPSERLYWGFFDGRAHVKKAGKWVEKNWVLCDRYLPYAVGGGYVISNDLVHYIASNWKLLRLYNSEDVTLGAWLAPLDIERRHDTRFDTEYKSRGCRNSYLITHKHTDLQIHQLYNNILNSGQLCTKEFQVRNSYIYNWNVLPSNCCIRNNSAIP